MSNRIVVTLGDGFVVTTEEVANDPVALGDLLADALKFRINALQKKDILWQMTRKQAFEKLILYAARNIGE